MKLLAAAAVFAMPGHATLAACDAHFDGNWAIKVTATDRCGIATFSNNSASDQTRADLVVIDDPQCGDSARLFEVEYDSDRHNNLAARMIDNNTCELTFGEGWMPSSIYDMSDPQWPPAHLEIVSSRRLRFCVQNQGPQFDQCMTYDYIQAWE